MNLTAENFHEKWFSMDIDDIVYIAERTDDIELLKLLSNHDLKNIKFGVIRNKNTPISLLEKMKSKEKDSDVISFINSQLEKRCGKNNVCPKKKISDSCPFDDELYPTRLTIYDD